MVAATLDSPPRRLSNAELLEELLKLLDAGITELEALSRQLSVSFERIAETMKSKELDVHLDTRLRLAQAAFRLKVAKLLPLAAKALEASLTCDKPEVVRRATAMVCHLNNLATSAPKQDDHIYPYGFHRR